jgi:hypothetical protein
VVCTCGKIDEAGDGIQKESEQEACRRLLCSSCNKYCNNRCSSINLGCRLTFQAYITDVNKTCPVGKW